MHHLKTGLLISLYLLFLVHLYLEVPGFLFLFLLLGAFVVIASWKETTDFNKKLDEVPYDFRIQKAEISSKKKDLIGYAILVLFLAAPFFIEIPWQQREDVDDILLFGILVMAIGYVTLLIQPQYDYYHFGEKFITGPGPELQPIPWRDIRAVETIKDKEIFYLKLKKDTVLKFDLKLYYSDRKWDEVMGYFDEKELKTYSSESFQK